MNGSGSVAGQGYGPRAKKKEQELELAKREYDSVRNINLAKIDIQTIKFSKTDSIMKMVGWTDDDMPEILISKTLQKESDTSLGFMQVFSAVGLYEPGHDRITILRSQLGSLKSYAGTLLHEAAHAASIYTNHIHSLSTTQIIPCTYKSGVKRTLR